MVKASKKSSKKQAGSSGSDRMAPVSGAPAQAEAPLQGPAHAGLQGGYEERFLDLWRDSLAAGLTPYLPESGASSLKDFAATFEAQVQGASQSVAEAAVRAFSEGGAGGPFGFAAQSARSNAQAASQNTQGAASGQDTQAAHHPFHSDAQPEEAGSKQSAKHVKGTQRVPRALALTLSQIGALWGASPLVAAQLAAHFNWQKINGATAPTQGGHAEQNSNKHAGQGTPGEATAKHSGANFGTYSDMHSHMHSGMHAPAQTSEPSATMQQVSEAFAEYFASYFGDLSIEQASALPAAAMVRAPKRLHKTLFGLNRYMRAAYKRAPGYSGGEIVWRRGAATVWDLAAKAPPSSAATPSKPIFLVPSLVNRAYILDLMPGHSFSAFLQEQGWRPYLLDWGEPQQDSEVLSLEAYVTERLMPAFDAACAHAAGRAEQGYAASKPSPRSKKTQEIDADNVAGNAPGMPVLGYCMGGTLSVALARLRPRTVTSLALLAAPWDMHQDAAHPFVALAPLLSGLAHMFDHVTREMVQAAMLGSVQPRFKPSQTVSADLLQALFNMLDPTLNDRKFSRFADAAEDSLYYDYFLALEHWANDGQDLSLSTAADCITQWYKDNLTGRRQWHVGGKRIDPALIKQPSLVVLPKQDRLVSEASAAALAHQLPNAEPLQAHGGHVSMVAGLSARTHLWEPLSAWLKAHS